MSTATINEILSSLNPEQKKAAEAIEGPVQVIAGPGTGKTQILASRIANILSKTDTDPWNILCLTFTEAGVIAMRKRLLQFIGPAAHQVQIHTFHSLCNQIIQDNQEFFGTSKLSPIDDIEMEKVLNEICETISPETPLYNTYDPYGIKFGLSKAFQTFKKENLGKSAIDKKLVAVEEEIRNSDDMYYKTTRKGHYNKGDFNERKFLPHKKSIAKLAQAAELYELYLKKLDTIQRYDFDDMILWVLEAFEKNEELLLTYQEQFQYVLTDEFQDTNGSQFKLIELLMNHWESPNIFSVGDDDQSIYAFQGANVTNMLGFGQLFNLGLQEFVLTTNYRSSPEILGAASALIIHNKERLINVRAHLTKDLVAHKASETKPIVAECNNPLHEASWVALKIEQNIKDGCNPNEIAVLYNKHKYAENLHRILQADKIPVSLNKSDNIFDISVIDFIIRILSYVNAEIQQPFSGEHELFRILHAPFFNINSLTLAEKAYELSKKRGLEKLWRRALQKEEPTLFNSAPIRQAMDLIEGWIKFATNHSPVSLVDKILQESEVIKLYTDPGKNTQAISSLTTLFTFIKERNEKNMDYTIQTCIEELNLLKNGPGINVVNSIQTDDGINFITIHSSKGLEFKHVYILANTTDNWDSSRSGNSGISLRPLFGNQDEKVAIKEEKRRLMYVAMTRAEQTLTLTYFNEKANGKSTGESNFISELIDSGTVEKEKVNLSGSQLENNSLTLLQNQLIKIELPNEKYIHKYLEGYTLSATHMNRYINCPIAFYYENLLRVPSAKSEAGCIGTAVHDALNIYFKAYKKEGSLPDVALLIGSLEKKMNDQFIYFNKATFNHRLTNTKSYLLAYFENNKEKWANENYFSTEKNLNAVVGEAPIKGFLDKLVFTGNDVHVVDYKTGNPDNAIKKMRPPETSYEGDDLDKKYGGEYWRQLMFYHFLINGDHRYTWRMTSAAVSCVEKDRKTSEIVPDLKLIPDQESLMIVKELIEKTYSNIKAGKFDEGCGKTNELMAYKNCDWCAFHSKLNH